MFNARNQCPICNATVIDWSSRCPKCRYHPDCDRGAYHNAQDDVALIARYRPTAPRPLAVAVNAWRQALSARLRHG